MPTGRISGDKIHVTGFTPSTTQEQYYKVVVSGKSTAEKTLGSSVLSNEAVVRRKKLARITLSNVGSNPECTKGGKLNISTVNVKDGTLIVVQYPSFVSSFRIEGNVLYYCMYPNYSTATPGIFVVAGTDIYGDTVLSNEYDVSNPGGDVAGEIDLYCGTTGNVNISIPGETTRLVLNYDLTGVIQSSVTVNGHTGDTTSIVVSTGDTTVTLTFPRNTSSVYGKEYRVTIKGNNQYGDVVISNEVVITHGKEGSDTEFYIIGNDIEANETSGVYQLFYPSNVIDSTIAVYDYSEDTITSEPVLYPGGSPMTVAVTTLPNTTQVNKTLVIYASARTQSNKTLYATGVIIQRTDCYLTIPTSTTDNVGVIDYTNPNHLPSYTQTHSFRYLVKNVQNIGAYISGGTGTVTVNTSTKTVTVNFSKNTTTGNANIIGSKVNDTTILLPLGNDSNLYNRRMLTVTQDRHIYGGSNTGGDSLADTELDPSTGGNRTFVIVVTGTSKNDSSVRLQAVYRFTQNASTEGGFTLTSGGTMNASIEYNTLSIRLDISYPSDTTYSGFAVSVNTTSPASYSSTLNVYDIRIVEDSEGVYLTGKTRVNNLDQSVTYTLQVSAMEAGNVTRYTNAFTITHRTHSVDGSIRFTGSTSRTVDASTTTVAGITFDYDNLSFAYVKQCTASDGSYANVTVFNYTGKTLTVEFAQYPSSQKTITIVLGGTSNTGIPCESGMFIITQRSSGSGSITIDPQSVTVGSQPTAFTYHVTYSDVEELDPIYNAGVFDDVSNSGARILTTNTTLEDDTYQITFRGRRLSDGVTLSATLTVTQSARTPEPAITIKSSSDKYNADIHAYVINKEEGSYPLDIITNDVQFNSLRAYVSGDNPNVTANTVGERINFGEVFDTATTEVFVTGLSEDGVTTVTSNTITFIQALEEGGGGGGLERMITATTNVANTVLSIEPGGTVVDTQTLEEVGREYFLGPVPRNYWISPGIWAVYYTASCPGYITQDGVAAAVMNLVMIEDSPDVMQDVNYTLPWGGHYDYIHDGGTCDSNLIHLEVQSDGPFTATCINTNSWMYFPYGSGTSTIIKNTGTRLSDYSFYTAYNAGIYDRQCTITVSTRDVSKHTTFTQPALSADFGVYVKDGGSSPSTAPASGGNVTFKFYYYGIKATGTTGSVTIQPYYSSNEVSSVSGIAVGLTDSTGTYGTATATLKPNNTGSPRTVIITLYDQSPIIGAGVSGEIHITQAG